MTEISFDEFKKIELRVATIEKAELVVGADKLIRLEIDLGSEKRQLIAGVAHKYSPTDLIGKQIIVVVNLQARAIKGLESKGMLLAALGSDGTLAIITPDKKMGNGAPVS